MDRKDFNKELNPSSLKDMVRRMGPLIRPYWFRALLGIAMTIPAGALDSTVAVFLKYYVDNVVVAKNATWAGYIPVLIILFTVVQGVLNFSSTYFNSWVGTKITTDLKKKLYKKLLTFDPCFFDTHNSGDVVYRFYTDADTASTTLISSIKDFLTRFFSSVGLICVLFYNSWQLTIIALIVLGAAVLPTQYVRKKIKKITPKIVTSGSDVITSYNETCNGYKTIASYNLQDYQLKKQYGMIDEIFSLSMKMVKHTNWLSPVMHIVISFGVAGVIWFGNSLIIKGTITSGNFASFIAALLMLYTPIKSIGNKYIDIQKAFLAIERVFEMINFKPKIKSAQEAVKIDGIKESVEFDDVVFEYKPGLPVLKHVSLKVPIGKTIAIVGNSGGGKTTLVNLLPRFYDTTDGSVKIDGLDVKKIDLQSLRKHIAVVFQDNFLFSGTIRENIMIGNPEATQEDLDKAVQSAHLEDFIASLKEGLDTYVGERGVMLSGGQKQRIAIARAFLKQAPVVILDEATSALDNKSEAIVQKAIDNLMRNRTVFVIAHRLSTVQNADKIIVVNEGTIVESGTHEELMKEGNGAYKALYNAQFKKKKEVSDEK
ncbi:ABC transporter ATP-binding protein [Candidatus Proelusimicrobium excrementi]|uniref:ABC transporter ATP-binding protein n=1 Tax=Candidatus Proelusimicrobium excrementi TaxID=3416222 RepID=UPI003CA74D5C|nr:ABC transporter ATP-binding protein [Elusimicrobiaceae bacterium]